MAKILNIETSTVTCSIGLSIDGNIVAIEESHERNSHAQNVTIFSEKVVKDAGLDFNELDAISVSKGPGSYTGLRIGVSTAKGFCYSLDKPLIAINTLQALAAAIINNMERSQDCLFCPMIDARRMEVYSAIFDHELNEVRETKAEIIDANSFNEFLSEQTVVFAGDGAEKCKTILGHHTNAIFLDDLFPSTRFMCGLSEQAFKKKEFVDVAYFEPFYLKDFVAGIPRVKGLR